MATRTGELVVAKLGRAITTSVNVSVSNIIWKKGVRHLTSFLDLLESREIRGVELALSCFWDEPTEANKTEVKWLKNELAARAIEPVSLHSLTFSRPDLEIFNSKKQRSELRDYIVSYCDIANKLGCKNIVFGSPKSRVTYGKCRNELNHIFLDFICEIDRAISDVNFNIEPLSRQFCEYLNNFQNCVDLLDGQNFRKIFIQLDARTVIESNESVAGIFQNSEYIRHVHASNPGLKVPGEPYSEIHAAIKHGLDQMGYQGYVTAEVIADDKLPDSQYLEVVIDSMMGLYGG